MALEAERFLDGSGWLPVPLRRDDLDFGSEDVAEDAGIQLPAFISDEEEERQHLIAAE